MDLISKRRVKRLLHYFSDIQKLINETFRLETFVANLDAVLRGYLQFKPADDELQLWSREVCDTFDELQHAKDTLKFHCLKVKLLKEEDAAQWSRKI